MNKLSSESNSTIERVIGSKIRIRILQILIQEGEISLTSLINKIRTNYITTLEHLHILQDNDLIEEHRFGRIRMLRYIYENTRARMLQDLFAIWEKTTVDSDIP